MPRNSIGTDRRFLVAHLPEIEEFLHYRSVDVSTIKELTRRWYPGALDSVPRKATAHRALDEIESAALLASALAVLPAGCGEDEPDLPTPVVAPSHASETPTPTTTLSPAEVEAVEEVLALYDGYFTDYVALATGEEPVATASRLLQYAEPDLAVGARNEIVQNLIDERVFTGDLSWTLLEPAEVDLARSVDGENRPQVVFRVCVDGSAWELVDQGGTVVQEPPGRYVSTVTGQWREEREFGPDGWALHAQQDDDRSETC